MKIFSSHLTGSQGENDDDEIRTNHSGTESGIRDEFSDIDGRSLGWLPRVKFSDCVVRGIFRVLVDMMSVNTVSYQLNGPHTNDIFFFSPICLLQVK